MDVSILGGDLEKIDAVKRDWNVTRWFLASYELNSAPDVGIIRPFGKKVVPRKLFQVVRVDEVL
ncbi:hypothetical protein K0M31_005881 [Melipona bicolor]|uniref:Uncharacterized protein n=1 Tax=Melipona bicolor TaxID=60889 RepID=A0AA40FUF1_9HYME|nr:hypothetical protein K0M31_005881 [Melipona bicolor]